LGFEEVGMRIFICCSKHIYEKIPPIREKLEKAGHVITLPNSFDAPMKEEEMKKLSREEHAEWKGKMLRLQIEKIQNNDALLILNLEKHGQQNYIGGATFLEMFKAWETGKKIFLMNPIPQNSLEDEIKAFKPIILNGDLEMIK
jgi:hypothetical protein